MIESTILSLRGGNASEGSGNPSSLEGRRRVCLFAYWITVDRHARKGIAMTKLELGNDQRLIPLLPPSIFTLEVSSLGSFGPVGLPPCLGQDSPRSPALLAFLETDTEATAAAAAARGVAAALSRTQGRSDADPGTTP